MADKYIRFDDAEAAKMIVAMAAEDRRSEGITTAILIRQEWARRHGEKDLNDWQPEAFAAEPTVLP